jgi:hypothetical protein
MSDLTKIEANFEVFAGTSGECEIDITGLTPDEIAELVEQSADAYPTVCHQCARDIDDPQLGDMTSFSVGDVYYEKVGDHWVVSS